VRRTEVLDEAPAGRTSACADGGCVDDGRRSAQTYRFPAPEGAKTVAVKLIGMLGEAVLVTADV
jgi:hypothetical protein